MKFQTKLNFETMYYEIVDPANKLSAEIINILNDVIQCREDRDFDFLSDISIYTSKSFHNNYVEFSSRSSLSVLNEVRTYVRDNRLHMKECEKIEMSFSEMLRADLSSVSINF